jgi:hypothetical protein
MRVNRSGMRVKKMKKTQGLGTSCQVGWAGKDMQVERAG